MSAWLIITVSLAYVALLFVIAHYGDRLARQQGRAGSRPIVYSLSLAVYCTSWTFFGNVGRAASSGWDFLPIYLGPIIALVVFGPVLRKIILISKQQNITSIADFIASRYGKSQGLAALVTSIAVVVILPYIALQLKGVALAFDTLTAGASEGPAGSPRTSPWADTALYLALTMAAFSMLFGTRHVDTSESHQGIIYAIAFESVIKLVAFLAVGIFVVFGMFEGAGDLFRRASTDTKFTELFQHQPITTSFLTTTLMAIAAIFCLPRQFHVGVVENTDIRDLRTARWLFPLYLVVFGLFVIPIAAAGLILFPPGSVNADRFVLALPMAADANGLALFAFIGGFSAATGMVIMATVALATMVCNDVVIPSLMRWRRLRLAQRRDLSGLLLTIRRLVILGTLLLAYLYYRVFGDFAMLAAIGLLSFAGILQFLPALVGGLYVRGITRRAAFAGLAAGFAVWGYTLLLPNLATAGLVPVALVDNGPLGMAWLRPEMLFGWGLGDPVSHGVLWSLTANIGVLIVVSLFSTSTLIERIQANAFVRLTDNRARRHGLDSAPTATIGDLQVVLQRFLGAQQAQSALADYAGRHRLTLHAGEKADTRLINFSERLLAGVIGSASARLVLESAIRHKDLAINDVVDLLDQTAEAVQFNRTLLQAALDNLSQGVSVIDRDLRLVAWNRRYESLFDYPEGMIRVGRPVADLIRFNAERGECGPGSVKHHVRKRLGYMRRGQAHVFQRTRRDGTVLEMHGNPMPGGGFVTTFGDITAHKRTEKALREVNETLEQRVTERTTAVSRVNAELRRENEQRSRAEQEAKQARDEAERANLSKTRFLAAASHDLLQPLNAARLFTSALLQQQGEPPREMVENIEHSLQAAESLLASLLDISKLDAGAWDMEITDFRLDDLLNKLAAEFGVVAADSGLTLRAVPCRAVVRSDHQLLRRIIQNFLSNAVRYTPTGRILLGCRRQADSIRIEVWDTGPGIPAQELDAIFEEFHRLDKHDQAGERGLGLGLAIADRMARLLGHRIDVRSHPGRGTLFSVTVPRGDATRLSPAADTPRHVGGDLRHLSVLCIDDNPAVLEGLGALLKGWGCNVDSVEGAADIPDQRPDIILADFHLHGESDGLSLLQQLRQRWDPDLPAIVITADRSPEVRRAVQAANCGLLEKPVKPAALRAMLTQVLVRSISDAALRTG